MLLLGLDEAGPLFGCDQPGAVFAAATASGVGQTVVKAGADGCYVVSDGALAHLPSAATTVVDPVGAGDAFAGGYLYGWLAGWAPYACAWLGGAMAARVLATVGDTDGLPTPAEAAALTAAALAEV